jgi:DNA-binding Lrp family transcriptional regulator
MTNGTAPQRQKEKERFGRLPVWITEAASGSACRVYALLAGQYADWTTGEGARPRVATIADRLGVSTRTVQRALRELEALGAMVTEKRLDARGHQTSNGYTVHADPPRHLSAVPDPGDVRVTPGVTSVSPIARASLGVELDPGEHSARFARGSPPQAATPEVSSADDLTDEYFATPPRALVTMQRLAEVDPGADPYAVIAEFCPPGSAGERAAWCGWRRYRARAPDAEGPFPVHDEQEVPA